MVVISCSSPDKPVRFVYWWSLSAALPQTSRSGLYTDGGYQLLLPKQTGQVCILMVVIICSSPGKQVRFVYWCGYHLLFLRQASQVCIQMTVTSCSFQDKPVRFVYWWSLSAALPQTSQSGLYTYGRYQLLFPRQSGQVCILMVVISCSYPDRQVRFVYWWWLSSALPQASRSGLCTDGGYHLLFLRQASQVCVLMVVISCSSQDKPVRFVYWWSLSAALPQTSRPGLYTDGGYQLLLSRQTGQVCILMVVIICSSPGKQVKFVYWWWLSSALPKTSKSGLYTDGRYQMLFPRQAGQVCILMVVISCSSPDKPVRFVYLWSLSAALPQTSQSGLYTDGGYQLLLPRQTGQVCILMVVIICSSPGKQVRFVYWWWLSSALPKTSKSGLCTDGGFQLLFPRQAGQVCILMVVNSCSSQDKQVRFVYWWWLSAALPQTSRSGLYTDGRYQLLFPRQAGQVCILMVIISCSSPDKPVRFVYWWWLSAALTQTDRSGLCTDGGYHLLFLRQASQVCIQMTVTSCSFQDKPVRFVYWWSLSAALPQTSQSGLYTYGRYQLLFPRQAGQVCILMVVISCSYPNRQVRFVYWWWLSSALPQASRSGLCTDGGYHLLFLRQASQVCVLMVVISCSSPDKPVRFVYWWSLSAALPQTSRSGLYTDGRYQLLFPRQAGQVCILMMVISCSYPDRQVRFVYWWWLSSALPQASRSSLCTDGGYHLLFLRQASQVCILMLVISCSFPDKPVRFVYWWSLSAALPQTSQSGLYTYGRYQLLFPRQAGQVCILMVVISCSYPDRQVRFVYWWWLSSALPQASRSGLCTDGGYHLLFLRQASQVCVLMVVISCSSQDKPVRFVYWWSLSAALPKTSKSGLCTDGGYQLLFPRQAGQVCILMVVISCSSPDKPVRFVYWLSLSAALPQTSRSGLYTDGGYQLLLPRQTGQVCILMVVIICSSPGKQVRFVYWWWLSSALPQASKSGLCTDGGYQLLLPRQTGQVCILMVVIICSSPGKPVMVQLLFPRQAGQVCILMVVISCSSQDKPVRFYTDDGSAALPQTSRSGLYTDGGYHLLFPRQAGQVCILIVIIICFFQDKQVRFVY